MSDPLSKMGEETQLATLLRLWQHDLIAPIPIDGLGPLPARPTAPSRSLHRFFQVGFGLLLADGFDGPMMVATSLLVNMEIVATQPGASWLLREFERLRIVWSPYSMDPIKGRRDGTKVWLPGSKPNVPEPSGGWRNADPELLRVRPASLDGVPSPSGESGSVPIEAEDVKCGAPIQPAMEAPDEPLVACAVDRGARRLDGAAASDNAAGATVGSGWHGINDNPAIGADPLTQKQDKR